MANAKPAKLSIEEQIREAAAAVNESNTRVKTAKINATDKVQIKISNGTNPVAEFYENQSKPEGKTEIRYAKADSGKIKIKVTTF